MQDDQFCEQRPSLELKHVLTEIILDRIAGPFAKPKRTSAN
jgi:hypothetical protein